MKPVLDRPWTRIPLFYQSFLCVSLLLWLEYFTMFRQTIHFQLMWYDQRIWYDLFGSFVVVVHNNRLFILKWEGMLALINC